MRITNRVVTTALAACVLGLAVFLTRADPDVDVVVGGVANSDAAAATTPTAANPADAAPVATDRAMQRRAPDPVPTPSQDAPSVAVKVVHAESGDPVPGATVDPSPGISWMGAGSIQGKDLSPEARDRALQWLQDQPEVHTDGNGEAEFAWIFDDISLRASTPSGLFGRRPSQELTGEPLVVSVRQDLCLRVAVLHRGSSVAVGDVPVHLGVVDGDRPGHRLRRRRSRVTDSQTGVARFDHVQEWFVAVEGQGVAWVGIPVRKPETLRVTEDDARGSLVHLEMPETGSLLVRAVSDRNGRKLAGVKLQVLAFNEDRLGTMVSTSSRWSLGTTDENGELRIPHVGLGLWIGASPRGSSLSGLTGERHRGPRNPGETCELVVEVPEDTHILTGKLVTSEGEPWRRKNVTPAVSCEGRSVVPRFGRSCSTDDEGVFELEFRSAWNGRGEVTIQGRRRGKTAAPLAYRTLDGTETVEGRTDLGVLVLGLGPVVAAGRVVSAKDGSPVMATLQAKVLGPEGAMRGDAMLTGNHLWTDEGRFAIYAAPSCELSGCSVRLEARASSFATTEWNGPVGREDLVVEAHELGVVKGHVRLLGDVVPEECALLLRQGRTGVGTAEIEPNGDFAFAGVAPGSYEFLACLRSEYLLPKPRRRVVIPDVMVSFDSTTEDPRMANLEFGSDHPWTELQVTSDEGGPPDMAWVSLADGDQGGSTYVQNGRVRLRLLMPVKIRVTSSGYEPWVGEAQSDVTHAALQQAK